MRGLERSVLVVGVSLMATACGKKGPLIYPDMLVPAAPSALTVLQSGSAIKLSFALPGKDRSGRPVRDVAGVKIKRKAAETQQKDHCQSCMTDYSFFKTLYLDHLPANAQQSGNMLLFVDGDVSTDYSYSYNIIPFTAAGVDGASATTVAVRVDSPLSAPILKMESLPTELRLQATSQSIAGGTLMGYNYYRHSGVRVKPYVPLNREPLKDSSYVDSGLERGVVYRYSARSMFKLSSGDFVESVESNEVTGMLADE